MTIEPASTKQVFSKVIIEDTKMVRESLHLLLFSLTLKTYKILGLGLSKIHSAGQQMCLRPGLCSSWNLHCSPVIHSILVRSGLFSHTYLKCLRANLLY